MSAGSPFLVGIAGGSGSGKTTLARAIHDGLGSGACARLEQDAYYLDLSHLPLAQRHETNFDHPSALDNDLLHQHITLLRGGSSVPRLRYDFATHTRQPPVDEIPCRPVVIVEGILLMSVAVLCDSLDLRVFMDAPADIRFIRRLQRDLVERGRDPHGVCRQYLDSVRPMHEQFVEPSRACADLVLSGTEPLERGVAALHEEIRARREGF